MMKDSTILIIFGSLEFIKCEDEPKILSCLYGYDNCIGSVNNFATDAEYLEDLKERNCTVEDGHTNVVDHKRCYCLYNIAHCNIDDLKEALNLSFKSNIVVIE